MRLIILMNVLNQKEKQKQNRNKTKKRNKIKRRKVLTYENSKFLMALKVKYFEQEIRHMEKN